MTVRAGAQSSSSADTRTLLHTWFVPGTGWRTDLDSTGSPGGHRSSFVFDGATLWSEDPATNRYTRQSDPPGFSDPRALTVTYGRTAGTMDLMSAIMAFGSDAHGAVTREGSATVAGRAVEVILVTPYGCSVSAGAEYSRSGIVTASPGPTICNGSVRYWLDTGTGWPLRVEADDGEGGGFSLSTISATFDGPADGRLLQFTPPPGSTRVDSLGQ
ncbi:MAG: hypothetical protein ACYDCQ_16385 [Dehalococcoidia bacterium]